jgi:4-amino-4-deoxy-L-arabinose transferase-like glycosyltransferase
LQCWKPILSIAVFLVALMPVAANYAIHHPDEQYYTAGAIEMLRSGDWATPRDENGAPRFQKPVLAYWLIAASYALFGVSALSSRFPFLLAGCAVLGLTYLTARDVTGDRRAATFAMLALLSQPQFVLASLRSMTDVVLALGILVSAFGFLAVIRGERSRPHFLAAYGGAAVAFLSKGLLALVFVLYVFGFVLLDRRRKAAVKELVEPVSATVAILAVSSWFAVVYAQHGAAVLEGFWSDQTARRFHPDLLRPLWLAPALALSYFATFLPWSMPALVLMRGTRAAPSRPPVASERMASSSTRIPSQSGERPSPIREKKRVRVFLVGWALLLAALFAGARDLEEHYLLPAVPFVAILIGDLLASADPEAAGRALRRSFSVTLVVVLLGAALMVWADAQLEGQGVSLVLLLCLTVAVAALGYAALGRRWVEPATAQALAILAVFPMLLATMRPIALPDQGEQLARRLEELRLDEGGEILFVGKLGTAGKLRVALRGRVRLHRVERLGDATRDGYRAIVLPRAAAAALAGAGDRIHAGSRGYDKLDVARLFAAVFTGELNDFLARHRSELVILVLAPHAEA